MNAQPIRLTPQQADTAVLIAIKVCNQKVQTGTSPASAWDEYEATRRIIEDMSGEAHHGQS